MAYFRPLQEAAIWLKDHVQPDGGWGLTPGEASSLVNTAEALFVLRKAGCSMSDCAGGLRFIEQNFARHLKERGPRTRFVALPLMVLGGCFQGTRPRLVSQLKAALLSGRNADDGWGINLRDAPSDILSTYQAVEALVAVGGHQAEIEAAGRWVLAKSLAAGWPMHEGQPYSVTATAYAIQILHHAYLSDTPAYRSGLDLLLTIETFELEHSVIPGTAWVHSRAGALLRAFVSAGIEPFNNTIADALIAFNKVMIQGLGWRETEGANGPTVRSQFWAVHALSAVSENLDVAIWVPRIAAERGQGTLKEPYFLPFLVRTSWHFILPARLFRWSVYALLVLGSAMIADLKVPELPYEDRLELGAGILMVTAALFMVRKRPTQFRRSARLVGFLLVVLAFVHAVWGWSAVDLIEWLKSGLHWIWGHVSIRL